MNDIVPLPDQSPLVLFTRATDVAGVCGEIVKRTARFIQGRKYVQVEGWQSIAAAYGCIASATHVEHLEGGVRAIGELRRASDGALLGTAEGFVGEDEPTWFGGEAKGKMLPKRPEYAIRAMAQTRAISRVCRTAFAFVVVLIDAKLATTPAEEMDPDWTEGIKDAAPQEVLRGEAVAKHAQNERSVAASGTRVSTVGIASENSLVTEITAPAVAAPRTRTDTLKDLCKKAGANYIDLLAKAEVRTAEEMSDVDYQSAVRMLNRKITMATAQMPAEQG